MVVIADTSPINYLVLIKAIDVLPRLYGGVTIPQPVLEELRHPETPQQVAEWANELPEWVEVATVRLNVDVELAELDAGEAAAIALAQARRRHILTIGTLGILPDAAALGFVDLATAFVR